MQKGRKPEIRTDISLILPAFNERERILSTIQEAVHFFEGSGLGYEIIVVADGTDGTRDLVSQTYASDACVRVMGSPTRRGKGKGIREGILASTGTWVGFADADNKTPISEFSKIRPYLESGVGLVMGTRRMAGESRSKRRWYRVFGSATFNALVQTSMGLSGIPDTQCGFKFFQHRTAQELFSKQKIDGYMFDVEILVLAKKQGVSITQVPIEWRDDQDSRLKLVRGSLQNFRDLLRIRLYA